MKQGSADDPFADDPDDAPDDAGVDNGTESLTDGVDDSSLLGGDADPPAGTRDRSLPYIHARDGVKDGRKQRPVFLRDHIETGIDDLVAQMEAEFGEDVYKTDVTEAAMAVAEDNPELVREKLDEWGYGWA